MVQITVGSLQEIQSDAQVYGRQCPCVFGFYYDPTCGPSCTWKEFYPDSVEAQRANEEREAKYPTYFGRDDSVHVTAEDADADIEAAVYAKVFEICTREKITDGHHIRHLVCTMMDETYKSMA